MIKAYYSLTKPGIVYGNALSVVAGFFLASRRHPDLWLLFETLIGISLVMASSCVFNNYLDRDIDRHMARTQKRPSVTEEIPVRSQVAFAAILGLMGTTFLIFFTNPLTTALGLCGLFAYVVVYGMWWKRRSVHGTAVGSISGAIPPLVGYCAVSDRLDLGALILFLLLVFWQMPHFYAIAMYRMGDYAAAGIPVLPLRRGLAATKRQIVAYVVAFLIAVVALNFLGYVGYWYLVAMLALSTIWLYRGLQGFRPGTDDTGWARKMFFFSLIILMALCVMISVDTLAR